MLFNSYLFIFTFLPIVLFGSYALNRLYPKIGIYWLAGCSFFFYGWWNPANLFYLVPSVIFNYAISFHLAKFRKTWVLVLAISLNLLILAYFKYAAFLMGIVVPETSLPDFIKNVVLPLGISFFTFQQIAYLVDIWRGEIKPPAHFVEHALLVSFFPHLIAGPIVKYQELVPQFSQFFTKRQLSEVNLVLTGGTIFLIGLFKKTCIADVLSPFVKDIFNYPAKGYEMSFVDSWLGAIAYTFQLYFDFSAYSDMAIGLAYMLGIKIPINFYSPYKALNIIDFWRRWHITLSRFFRDYLYIPMGGNRVGRIRQHAHIFGVMVMAGFWHGAGWTFILWGCYHGILVVLNHCWQDFRSLLTAFTPSSRVLCAGSKMFKHLYLTLSWLLTFVLVVFGWVLFRADNVANATNIYHGMLMHHKFFPYSRALIHTWNYIGLISILIVTFLIIVLLPNTIQFMRKIEIVLNDKQYLEKYRASFFYPAWSQNFSSACIIGALSYFAIINITHNVHEFLYFNF